MAPLLRPLTCELLGGLVLLCPKKMALQYLIPDFRLVPTLQTLDSAAIAEILLTICRLR